MAMNEGSFAPEQLKKWMSGGFFETFACRQNKYACSKPHISTINLVRFEEENTGEQSMQIDKDEKQRFAKMSFCAEKEALHSIQHVSLYLLLTLVNYFTYVLM